MPVSFGDQKPDDGTILVDELLVARGTARLIGLEDTETEPDVGIVEFSGQVVAGGGWVTPGHRTRITVALTEALALGMAKQLLEFFVWVRIADMEASANTKLATENEKLKAENEKLKNVLRYK